ncbi:MAG: hypothetical protein QS721_03845 [Candidatus Endonucleobacter sp. (ex Gigantidas childressi)]|nr:hypothetical protein [Candidatus Endonucleobacter sp. (ex Gigantidas childressi)]
MYELGKVGLVVAIFYTACGSLRLARFNAQIEVTDSRYFTGLPSPAAAALVAGMIWALSDYGIDGKSVLVSLMAAMVVALAGILMCSNIRYYSFKKIDLRGRVHFVFMLAIILIFAVIFTDPPRVLMLVFLGYACTGPVMVIYRFFHTDKKIDHTTH